jgi:hypothetical protein
MASGVPSARTSSAGLAERQRRGLGEEVRQEQLVHVGSPSERVRRVGDRDEVGRDERVPWWISW